MTVADALTAAGANLKNIQLLGTGLWDNPRVFASPALQGGLYAAPDPSGFRSFSGRYRAKFGADPVRTATLAYDAVALVAALARTQGPQRFSPEVLTNPSGFAGIDGLFRFRADGTNERGLAVMRVGSGGRHAGRRFAEEFWGLAPAPGGLPGPRSGTLRRQIRHHGIEHRKSGLRDAQPPAVIDHDGAFFAQHRNAARIERAAR